MQAGAHKHPSSAHQAGCVLHTHTIVLDADVLAILTPADIKGGICLGWNTIGIQLSNSFVIGQAVGATVEAVVVKDTAALGGCR